MKLLSLTRGLSAQIDDEDFERCSAIAWYAMPNSTNTGFYAVAKINGKQTTYLHRFLLDAPKGISVDHINNDSLDCRKHNLRLATQLQQCHNRKLRSDNRYGLKGVGQKPGQASYYANIGINGKKTYLGTFKTAQEAATAYDHAATRHFKLFAKTNFPTASINAAQPVNACIA